MTRPQTHRLPTTEHLVYGALAGALCAAYLFVAFALPAWSAHVVEQWFGFSQLRWAGAPLTLAVLALVLVRAARASLPNPPVARTLAMPRALSWIVIAGTATIVFFLLRNQFVNTDGHMFGGTFARALRKGGTVVTHDEMLEFYLHYRYWIVAHTWWGWGIKLTYQSVGCLAGGFFVLLLLEYCRMTMPAQPWTLFWSCLAGGYVQLFFGDVENYTLTATLIMAYLLSSAMYLRGRAPIWQPSLLLAIAMVFHLVAGFLTPSLAYLWMAAWRRRDRRGVIVSAATFAVVIAASVAFFHWNGLPLSAVVNSHAFGHGGHFTEMLVRPSIPYYRDLVNVVMLLAPATVLLVPLLIYRRIPFHAENVHLLIASGFLLLFVATWRAQIGVYQDWNLFAAAALPVSLLVWRNALALNLGRGLVRPIPVLCGLAMMHSLAWIVANHFR